MLKQLIFLLNIAVLTYSYSAEVSSEAKRLPRRSEVESKSSASTSVSIFSSLPVPRYADAFHTKKITGEKMQPVRQSNVVDRKQDITNSSDNFAESTQIHPSFLSRSRMDSGDSEAMESKHKPKKEYHVAHLVEHKEEVKVKVKVKHHHHHHHHNHVKTVYKKVPYEVKVNVPQPYPVEKKVPYPVEKIVEKIVEKKVPYPVIKKIPYKVEVKVPYKVVEKEVVHVPKPYPVIQIKHVPVEVKVPVPYTVEKKVPYPVEVKVPYPVEKRVPYPVPYKVEVEKKVPYPVKVYVPHPYPVEKKIPEPIKEHHIPEFKHTPYHVEAEKKGPVQYPQEEEKPLYQPSESRPRVQQVFFTNYPAEQRQIQLPFKLFDKSLDFKVPTAFAAEQSVPVEVRVAVPTGMEPWNMAPQPMGQFTPFVPSRIINVQ